MPDLKYIRDVVESSYNQERIVQDYKRYDIYNGAVKKYIEDSIRAQFKLPETINEMIQRIVPLNITHKIIQKLSTVYKQSPVRKPVDENPNDQELLNLYETELMIDKKMKSANSFFNLTKNTMIEPFLSSYGCPSMRILPSHAYTVLSFDPIDPTIPTCVVKNVYIDPNDKKKNVYNLWTPDQFFILNYEFEVNKYAMNAINNPDGINPYGVLPFTYINMSEDRLVPISDDDLVGMQIIIDMLLTDLCYGSKYQVFALIALIGAESEKLSFNPNSVISLPEGASIQSVRPEMDINSMLTLVKSLLASLLSSKNLKVDSGDNITVGDAVSGVSKMLDHAELTESREDQVEFFREAEEDFWFKFAHNILPVWVQSGNIDPDLAGNFSDGFELSITYPDMKIYVPEKERIQLVKEKLDLGLITKRDALKEIYPDLSYEQIDEKALELDNEEILKLKKIERNITLEDDKEQVS